MSLQIKIDRKNQISCHCEAPSEPRRTRKEERYRSSRKDNYKRRKPYEIKMYDYG